MTKKLSSEGLLKDHSIKVVVLKLRRLRKGHVESIKPPNQQEASHEKVIRFLSPAVPPALPPELNLKASVSTESSRLWRKFSDEQASFLFSITRDMIKSDKVKREVVWQRVKENQESLELELISGGKMRNKNTKQNSSYSRQRESNAKDIKGRQ